MADNLSARLKGLIGKTVTEEDMQDLAVAIADALDAAPPRERDGQADEADELQRETGLLEAVVAALNAYPTGLSCPKCKAPNAECHEDAHTHEHVCHACGYTQTFRGANVVPDSGADPEPVQQHSPLRTWPTDPETTP